MSSKSKTKTHTTQTLTPWAQQQYDDLSGAILGIAHQPVTPYGGPLSAGPDPLQQQAQAMAAGNLGLGRDTIDAAIAAAQAAGGHAPINVQAGSLNGMDLSGYVNPMLDVTAQGILGGLEHSREMAINRQAGDFTKEGAFGGSRHGVADGMTNEAYAGAAAGALNDLYSRGFDTAQAAAQADLDRGLRAATANQSAGLAGDQLGLSAAGLLGDLGLQQQQIGAADATLLNQFGTQNQAYSQQALDAAYQEFLRQQQWPLLQAGLMQGVLGATPMPVSVNGSSSSSSFNPLDWLKAAMQAAQTVASASAGGSGGGA